MRKLEANEKIIKEYDNFVLIERACAGGTYKTTIDKWERTDFKQYAPKEEGFHKSKLSF